MADIFSQEKRNFIMSKVKGTNTKPELLVRSYLFKKGLRYRLHQKALPGSPDIVLKKYKSVIFVNGCFWHGHADCKKANLPKTKTQFWQDKIGRNKNRDRKNEEILVGLGWKVLSIFECDLMAKKIEITMSKVINEITQDHI